MPGLHLTDGMAYEYAQQNQLLKLVHDFDEDILAVARNAAKRYQCKASRISKCAKIWQLVFLTRSKRARDSMTGTASLLRIAVILHGCGKFISLSNAGESAYHIIMAMDIIGLSEEEKEIVANVVKYNTVPLEGYDKIGSDRMTRENYLTIAKLTAILGVVNSLTATTSRRPKRQNRYCMKTNWSFSFIRTKICHWKRKSLQKSRIFSRKCSASVRCFASEKNDVTKEVCPYG